MSIWKKLFGGGQWFSGQQSQPDQYWEKDNKGTRQETKSQATSYWNHLSIYSIIIISLFVLNGCNSEKKEWGKATRAETLVSYQKYLNEFPQGLHVAEAHKRIRLTAIRGTLVNADNGTAIKKCKVYFTEVGPAGNSTLSNDQMGVTDDYGNFSLFVERAKLSKMHGIAFVIQRDAMVGFSGPWELDKNLDDALVINMGLCKVKVE